MQRSRLIVGLLLIGAAVLILLFAKGTGATAGAVAFAVMGLTMVAISRRPPAGPPGPR